jgi:hypothetical protein
MSDQSRPGHDELREGDLLAFLDGVAPTSIAEHIAGCPRCQDELAGLRAAEALLSAALVRADCPATEELLGFAAGLLVPDEQRRVATHVANCYDCAAELALLAKPPEPAVVGRLARAGVRLVRALLQPEAPPALAMRGHVPAARRAHYAAEGYEILVVVTPGRPAEGYALEGQILTPTGPRPGSAQLSGSAQGERSVEVDELGFFSFEGVPPGAYTLALDLVEASVISEILEVP